MNVKLRADLFGIVCTAVQFITLCLCCCAFHNLVSVLLCIS